MNRAELALFLRARRERLKPAEVGLPGGQRRRTPGLRRQEVAELAGLSVDYYIRLEQGRGPRPSRQVLSALARALMLSADERSYLFRVGGMEPGAGVSGPSLEVPAGVLHLLELMPLTPAYVVSARYDILAWNRLAVYFVGDLSSLPASERNMIRWMFDRSTSDTYWSDVEALEFARSTVADLRFAYGKYPGGNVAALVTELLALSPQFAEMWATQEVAERHAMVKRVDHPLVGRLEYTCQVLHIADTDQRLIAYAAEPGSATAEAFGRLATLAESAQAVGAGEARA